MTDILGILLVALFIAVIILAGKQRYKDNKIIRDFYEDKE